MYFVRECIRRHEAVIVVSYETGYLLIQYEYFVRAYLFFYKLNNLLFVQKVKKVFSNNNMNQY